MVRGPLRARIAQDPLSYLDSILYIYVYIKLEIWKPFISVICLLQFTSEYSHRNVSGMHIILYIVTLISAIIVDKKIAPHLISCLSKIVHGYKLLLVILNFGPSVGL